MKHMSKRHLTIPSIATVAIILAIGSPGIASAAKASFVAVLNSGQETLTPKPVSNAQGNALMTVDTATRMLCYSISYSDLYSAVPDSVGAETAAHFHGPASAGQSAPVLFEISPSISPIGSPKTGCVGPLKGKDMSNLKKGLFYINIHSASYPNGELRGQVFRVFDAKTNAQVAD